MRVKFNSLNRYETPVFTLCNPGTVYRGGTTSNTLGILTDTSDEEIVFNFNTTSQLSLRVTKIPRDDAEEDLFAEKMYDAIQNRRYIFVDDIGYFVITNISNETDIDGLSCKDITAESCEVEIQNKAVPYIENGTYQFDVLMDKLISVLPKWKTGHIAASVASKHRTFNDVPVDLNMLAFMLDNMQDAYECIFVFDIMNREIDVYDQNDYAITTDIHMTIGNPVTRMQIAENSSDLYTALRVTGGDNMSIAPLNPIGTGVIYDFSYYLEWMSDNLREKVVAWAQLVNENEKQYYDLNLDYYNRLGGISVLNAEISRLELLRSMYRQCRDNIVAQSSASAVRDYNEDIVDNGGEEIPIHEEIEETISAIDEMIRSIGTDIIMKTSALQIENEQLEVLQEQIDAIHRAVSFSSYFSAEEYNELCDYIYEGNYQDEYVIVTDIMSYAERFEQMKILYDRAKRQLKKISVPTQEFSADVESFLFIPEFSHWSEQLECGCLVNLELKQDDVAALFLSSMPVNYADHTIGMVFGNRFKRFDPKALFEDALGGIKKSANTIDFIKGVIDPITNGEFNAMQAALANSRTLTMASAIASKNEEIIIDGAGYTGRQITSDGTYDPRQVKLTSKALVFTNDGWQTATVAIGEIVFNDSTKAYGVNAQAIIGDLILGNNLTIKNNDGTDLFTAVDNRIAANMSGSYVTEENFAQILKQFNASIEADSEALRQYYKFHSELGDDVTDISAYIHTGHVADDSNGAPIYGVRLGRSDNEGSSSAIFTPDEIAFYDDSNEKVAFLSNKSMNVGTIRTSKIQLTDDLDNPDVNKWQIDTSGGFCIRWIGS